MSKSPADLATEITVAWLNAFSGQKESHGFVSNILSPEKIAEVYKTAFRTINEEWNRPAGK